MAINLASEYSTVLDKRFTQKSLTDSWCGHDYNWDGVNSINVWTLGQVTINDYTASGSNRFGTPQELEDEVNTYTLAQKKSFAATLDITNVQDQKNIKKANAVLKQVWDEQMVPMIDAYRLNTWANGAGLVNLNSTALTKSTIIEAILNASSAMNNELVNRDGRVCFVTESMAVACQLASELQYNEGYTNKAIVNGQISKLNGMPIVAVPDSWMPTGVEFMIKYKRASADPQKLKMLRAHTTVPGLAGTLLEGLVRYDSFVLAQKASGIYVYAQSGVAANVTFSISSHVATLTSSGATSIYYTVDGTNPKTSATRALYDSSSKPTLTSGTVIKAYAEKTGSMNSGITSAVDA